MGQYYKPAFLKSREPKSQADIQGWFYSHNHKTKWKTDDGRVVESGQGLKLMEHSYVRNTFVGHVERHLAVEPKRLVWAGDYADTEPGVEIDIDGELTDANVYNLCEDTAEIKPPRRSLKPIGKRHRYLVNLDKNEFVDKDKCPDIPEWEGTQIHPLPLLTCEGNGRGGGDYRANHPLVGTWARDLISVATRKPKGMKELIPNFQE